MFKRFRWKISTVALSFVLVFYSFAGAAVPNVNAEEDKEIKNIIFMIGDGMGPAMTTAYRYMQDEDSSTPAMKDTLFDKHLVGMQSTFSEDGEENVTDSSAAATAMSTGEKTYNGAVGIDNDGTKLKTVLEQSKEVGKATGMVTTVQLPHATPASYASHVTERHKYDEIANQYYDDLINGEHKVDVLLGGGTDYFKREDRNLVKEFKNDGYNYVTNTNELKKNDSNQLLGLFAPVGMPKAIDRPAEDPSLTEMTKEAIESLKQDKDGFFLMVEAGQIDWGAHDNDIVATMSEMKEYEQAMKAAIEFAKEDEETLVVGTADHSTGGLTVGRGHDYNWNQDYVKGISHTPDWMSEEISEGAEIRNILDENFNYSLTEKEIQSVIDAKKNADKEKVAEDVDNAIEHIIDVRSGTGWTTSGHTGVDVPVIAYGPGSKYFSGKIDNTDNAANIFSFIGYHDVTPDNTHFESIQWVTKKGIHGYPDGSFGVENELSRQHAAIFFTKTMNLEKPSADKVTEYFNDMNPKAEYADYVAAVGKAGIFGGSDGKYMPSENLTRSQMATVLVRSYDLEEPDEQVDVNLENVSKTHKKNVQIIADLGITTEQDNFRPAEAVTRGQFASFLHRSKKAAHKQLLERGKKVQLLGINDFHGQVTNTDEVGGKTVGGATYLSAHLKNAEQENPENTLKVHAGDIVGASEPTSALLQDEPTIEIMDEIGFDVGTLGNHEFDEGVKEMNRLLKGNGKDHVKNYDGADFPYVAANAVDKETKETILPPYMVKEVNGEKIGFIGVVTQDTKNIVVPESIQDVEFTDPVKAIDKAVKDLQEKDVESVVVLAHIPAWSNKQGTEKDGSTIEMAKEMNDEVDVIFSGHNHSFTNTVVDNKLIVQSYSYGTAFSDVDLVIDPRTNDIALKESEIVTTYHDTITPDSNVQEMLDEYNTQVQDEINRKVGNAAEAITRSSDDSGESPLGNVIADSQRSALDADFAFMNPGGIRANLNKGEITWGELYSIQPFGNQMTNLTMTGEQIKAVLEQQFSNDGNTILQISGLNYTWSKDNAIGEKVNNMTDGEGNPVKMDKEYKVAINNFLATGGDGFTKFKAGTDKVPGPVDLDALVEYINDMSESLSSPVTDRINVK